MPRGGVVGRGAVGRWAPLPSGGVVGRWRRCRGAGSGGRGRQVTLPRGGAGGGGAVAGGGRLCRVAWPFRRGEASNGGRAPFPRGGRTRPVRGPNDPQSPDHADLAAWREILSPCPVEREFSSASRGSAWRNWSHSPAERNGRGSRPVVAPLGRNWSHSPAEREGTTASTSTTGIGRRYWAGPRERQAAAARGPTGKGRSGTRAHGKRPQRRAGPREKAAAARGSREKAAAARGPTKRPQRRAGPREKAAAARGPTGKGRSGARAHGKRPPRRTPGHRSGTLGHRSGTLGHRSGARAHGKRPQRHAGPPQRRAGIPRQPMEIGRQPRAGERARPFSGERVAAAG